MAPLGPTSNVSSVSGAVDIDGVIQMLSGQARQNMVPILDVAMPAPALTGGNMNNVYVNPDGERCM